MNTLYFIIIINVKMMISQLIWWQKYKKTVNNETFSQIFFKKNCNLKKFA